MKRAADHEKFVGIMHSIARVEEMEARDKRKEEKKTEVTPTCFNCEKRKECKKFNGKITFDGVYSVGGDISNNEVCDKWSQKKDEVNDPKKVKSLLKKFKKLNNR